MNIGFFDSGIGGISVAREVMRVLPHYSYVYHADDLHMPYGSKHAQTLFELTTRALRKLFTQHNCALVILACNTATTVLPRIQQEWLPINFPDRKVLGVIRPTVEHMTELQSEHPMFLLATAQTVRAQSYDHELTKIGKKCDFHEIACPKLAQAIEESENMENDTYIRNLLKRYLQSVPKDTPVTIYTGCTHFEFVSGYIRESHPHADIHTQSSIIKDKFAYYLSQHLELKGRLKVILNQNTNITCSSGSDAYLQKLHTLLAYS